MSRTHTVSSSSPSHNVPSHTAPSAIRYNTFIWDTGTTGKFPLSDYLHSLAAVEYIPSSDLSSPLHFSALIRPPSHNPSPTIPSFRTAYKAFHSFITSATPPGAVPLLVAHNTPFDAAFLAAELARAGLDPPNWRFACSLALARSGVLPIGEGFQPCGQKALAERFNIHVSREHHACDDVKVLRGILRHVDNQLKSEGDDVQERLWQHALPLNAWAEDEPDSDCETSPADTTSSFSAMRRSGSSFASGAAITAESSPGNPAFITTRNGRYFHTDPQCYNLRSAKKLIRVAHQPSDLTPCTRCVRGGKTKSDATPQQHARGKAGDLSYAPRGAASSSTAAVVSRGTPKAGKYITTNTGRLYHLNEACNSLRFAKQKHWVSAKPKGLSPCPRCVGDPNGAGGRPGAWRPVDKVINGSTGGSGGRPRVKTYITTKTGKYYHGDEDCRYLRSANVKIPVATVPSRLAPCPKCVDSRDVANPSPLPPPVGSVVDVRPVQRYGDESGRASAGIGASLKTYGSGFYKTLSGKKFHVDKSCRHLQDRGFYECDPMKENKDPCRTCALELFQEWEVAGWTNRKLCV